MTRWSAASFLCSLLLATSALAEAKQLMDDTEINTSAISVSTPKDISSNTTGLVSPGETELPDTLWKDMKDGDLERLLQGITGGILSPSLRSLAVRTLAASVEAPETQADLLADRADALLTLGQAELAARLLAQVPQGYRTERQEQLAYLLLIISNEPEQQVCKTAEEKLAAHAEPFWQRWMVLCQAKAGETDKAQLALDLLSEQNEFSEFFQKLAQSLLTKAPLSKLPEVVFFEQAAWLHFAGQQSYLSTQQHPPLALLGLIPAAKLPESWQSLATAYGVHENPLQAPKPPAFQPPLSGLQLTGDASPQKKRTAFLTYGLRKALELPVSQEAEQALQTAFYEAQGTVLSPAWRESLREAANRGQAGYVALLLGSTLTDDINQYAPSDLSLAVEALMKSGLTSDASAFASEIMQAARLPE